ncbi:MAG: beta-lactamase hydrolase domain-containing protein [Pseudomonadota bacterium]
MKLSSSSLLASALSLLLAASPAMADGLPPVPNAVSPEAGVVSAGRLGPGNVAGVRDAGIRQVIDLTPDAETPDFDEATAVREAGMAYANLPLAGAKDLTPENVRRFDALLRDAERPVLVHCASGNRVGAMAALRAAWIEGRPAEEAIEVGRAWGLKGLEGEVRRRLEAAPAPASP